MQNLTNESDILLEIKKLNKILKTDFDKRMETYALTSQQARVLQFIAKECSLQKEVHQNDVEKRFDLSKSTVSGIIERLEKKNVIKKSISGFYCVLSPTNKGLDIVENIHKNRDNVISKLLKGFSNDKKIEIKDIISQLINNMEED